MRRFTIKYIIPLLILSLWCLPVFAGPYVPSTAYDTTGPGGSSNNLSKLILYSYYVTATFMVLMGAYQLALGFAKEEFSKNKKDGLVFMMFGAIIYVLAMGGGVTFGGSNVVSGNLVLHDNTVISTTIVQKISAGLQPIAEAVILWGVVHYIMAFTKDGLQDKHKGVGLIATGILIGFFAQFTVEIVSHI